MTRRLSPKQIPANSCRSTPSIGVISIFIRLVTNRLGWQRDVVKRGKQPWDPSDQAKAMKSGVIWLTVRNLEGLSKWSGLRLGCAIHFYYGTLPLARQHGLPTNSQHKPNHCHLNHRYTQYIWTGYSSTKLPYYIALPCDLCFYLCLQLSFTPPISI